MKLRELGGEERILAQAMGRYAFANSPADYETRYRERSEFRTEDLVLAIFEGDQIVSTATFIPMVQNIRGKVIPMSGVASVVTYPQARRRGYVRKLMTEGFRRMRDRGHVVSTLYPFRESFYERMGYCVFPQMKNANIDPAKIRKSLRVVPKGRVVRYSTETEMEIYRKFVKKYIRHRHSAVSFSDLRIGEMSKDPRWIAVAYDEEGEEIGLMTYTISGFEGKMKVRHFYTMNSTAKYLLLDWMGRHTDQVKNVIFPVRPDQHVATWLCDLKAELTSWSWVSSPMGRVVDIRGLSGIGVGFGEVCLKVEDEYCPWNEGVFTLRSVNGKLEIEEGGKAEACVSISGLSALVYGTHSPEDFVYLGYGDVNPILGTLHTLFPRQECSLNESF